MYDWKENIQNFTAINKNKIENKINLEGKKNEEIKKKENVELKDKNENKINQKDANRREKIEQDVEKDKNKSNNNKMGDIIKIGENKYIN